MALPQQTATRQSPRVALLPPWPMLCAVAAGGAIGAVARYALAVAHPVQPGRFPLVTFIENLTGAFLLGFVLVMIIERWRPTHYLHPFLCIGILGSFTTFSNYTVETAALVENGRPALAVGYAAASIVLGLIAAITGIKLGRHFPFARRRDAV